MKPLLILLCFSICFCMESLKFKRFVTMQGVKQHPQSQIPSPSSSNSNNVNTNFNVGSYDYMSQVDVLPRNVLSQLQSRPSKIHADLRAQTLNSYQSKFSRMTEEQERIAGKFSHVGKRLGTIRKMLSNKLGREPTDEEWASSCKMSVDQLYMYLDIAIRSRNKLVQHNMPLVDYWTRKIMQYSVPARQLISQYELENEGLKGLQKAAESYHGYYLRASSSSSSSGSNDDDDDDDNKEGFKGVRFGWYAQNEIRSALLKGITHLRPRNHVQHRDILAYTQLKRVEKLLKSQLGRPPTDDEIVDGLQTIGSSYRKKISVDYIKQLRRNGQKVQIDDRLEMRNSDDQGNNDRSKSYFDMHLSPGQKNIDNGQNQLLWQVNFINALECLSPTERRTLSIRYGIMDGHPRSVKKTAELMCMSPEGIRKTTIRALDKLRNHPENPMKYGEWSKQLETHLGMGAGTKSY